MLSSLAAPIFAPTPRTSKRGTKVDTVDESAEGSFAPVAADLPRQKLFSEVAAAFSPQAAQLQPRKAFGNVGNTMVRHLPSG